MANCPLLLLDFGLFIKKRRKGDVVDLLTYRGKKLFNSLFFQQFYRQEIAEQKHSSDREQPPAVPLGIAARQVMVVVTLSIINIAIAKLN